MAGRKYLISSIKKLENTVKNNIDVGPTIEKLGASLKDLENVRGIGDKISESFGAVNRNLEKFDLLIQAQEDTRRSINDMTNTLMQFRPLLDAVRQQQQQTQQSIASIGQSIQQLGQLMGQILAKLGQ